MERVLHCPIGDMNVDGISNVIMQIYRNIDKESFAFDFVVHQESEVAYEKEILNLGGKIYRIPYISRKPFEHIKLLSGLLEKHREYRIVHIHTSYAISVFDAMISKMHGRVVIVHSHSSNDKFAHKLFHRWFMPLQAKIADYRLSCSYIAGEWMFGAKEYHIWKNAIDLRGFMFNQQTRERIRGEMGLSENDMLIGNVGRLCYAKNQELLIRIFQKYYKDDKNSGLLLVGGGEDEAKLKALTLDLGISDKVHFTGAVNNVNEYLMAMDVFCLTSRWEGLPVSLIEAHTAGVSIVAFRSLVDRLIRDFSELYEIDDNASISDWVSKLKKVKHVSADFRIGCFEDVMKRGFDISSQVSEAESFYKSIMGDICGR